MRRADRSRSDSDTFLQYFYGLALLPEGRRRAGLVGAAPDVRRRSGRAHSAVRYWRRPSPIPLSQLAGDSGASRSVG